MKNETNRFGVLELPQAFQVFNTLKNKAARTCEIKHCRRCSREIKQYFISVLFHVVRTAIGAMPKI